MVSAAVGLLALSLLLVLGLGEAGRLYALGLFAGRAAELGVMAGLSRRDLAASQACGCPKLLADAPTYAERAVDLAFAQGGLDYGRSCWRVDDRTVSCRVQVRTDSGVLRLLGFAQPLLLVRTRTGVLEWQTR